MRRTLGGWLSAIVTAILLACSSDDPQAAGASIDDDAGRSLRDGSSDDSAIDATVDAGEASAADLTILFDGTNESFVQNWRMSTIANQPGRDDPGHFEVHDGALVSYPGTDLGLLWTKVSMPANFLLELEWKLTGANDNSGVFVRFPALDGKGYDNTAWVAVDFGFEIQIDETGRPDGADEHTTGAIYGLPNPEYQRVVAKPIGEWNAFSIRVEGQVYTVSLNGKQVTRYVNGDANRGVASSASAPSHVGLQTHDGNVHFRNVRVRVLD